MIRADALSNKYINSIEIGQKKQVQLFPVNNQIEMDFEFDCTFISYFRLKIEKN